MPQQPDPGKKPQYSLNRWLGALTAGVSVLGTRSLRVKKGGWENSYKSKRLKATRSAKDKVFSAKSGGTLRPMIH